jgi:hypothetical protein
MKSPFFIALAASGLGLLMAFLMVIWPLFGPPDARPGQKPPSAAPWRIEVLAPGRVQVMGLKLPGTTLAETRERWGQDLKLAFMAGSDGRLTLEGYLESFEAGGVTGRLMLAFDTQSEATAMRRWRDTLPGLPTASGGYQHALDDAAASALAATGLIGVSFIPLGQLDAEVLAARFGRPSERIATGGRLEHWLYPALGLAVVLDSEGREVLQYVAPDDFERLLAAPLRTLAAPG